jgi:NitT/TauT family transport system substrate-binding protein
MFLFADHGLKLYSNGILVKESYLAANAAQVRAFVKASLDGWRDTIANPKEAAEIVAKYIKGLDPGVVLQEIAIVNDLVLTADTKAKGLGAIDPATMAASVDMIARNTGAAGKVNARDAYDASYLPAQPVKP